MCTCLAYKLWSQTLCFDSAEAPIRGATQLLLEIPSTLTIKKLVGTLSFTRLKPVRLNNQQEQF